jgi:hypothetical protein
MIYRNQMDRNELKRELSLSKKSILSKSGRLASFIVIVHLLSFFVLFCSHMKLICCVCLSSKAQKQTVVYIEKEKNQRGNARPLFFLYFILNRGFGNNPHSLQLAEELSMAVLEDKKSLYRQKRQM